MQVQQINSPEYSSKSASVGATFLVFFISFAILASSAFLGLPFGKAIVGGLRVLEGDVPYRDFWSVYAPGQFYAVAALMGTFGREIVVQGLAAAVMLASAITIEYRIALRLGASNNLAFALAISLAVILWKPGLEFSTWVPAIPFMMGAWLNAIIYLQSGREKNLFFAGICLGCAAWFKHDVAAYAAIGISAGLFFAAVISREPNWSGIRAALRAPLIVGITSFFTVLPVAIFLAIFAGPQAWIDLIAYPLGDFRSVRTEQYPQAAPDIAALIEWLRNPMEMSAARHAFLRHKIWALSRIPEAILLGFIIVLPFWRRLTGHAPSGTTLLLVTSMPLFWLAAHVQQNTHLFTLVMLCGLLGVSAWVATASFSRHKTLSRCALILVAVVYWVGIAIAPVGEVARMLTSSGRLQTLDLPGVSGVLVPEDKYNIYKPISDYLIEHVPEGQPIYIGVRRHDAIVITDMRFLYMTGLRNASGHHELHPGITDREPVQRKIINEIEEAGVQYVLIWNFGWSDEMLDEIVARRAEKVDGVGATLLDEYIRSNFQPVHEVGEYVIMKRTEH